MYGEVMIFLRQKTRTWEKYLHQKTQDNYREFTVKSNNLSKLTTQLKDFEKDISENCKVNPKAFWRYALNKLKVKTEVGDLTKTIPTKTN